MKKQHKITTLRNRIGKKLRKHGRRAGQDSRNGNSSRENGREGQ